MVVLEVVVDEQWRARATVPLRLDIECVAEVIDDDIDVGLGDGLEIEMLMILCRAFDSSEDVEGLANLGKIALIG